MAPLSAIAATAAEMRRFMPNACGDWADRIDAAVAELRACGSATTHRGYVIRPHFGPGPSWYYQHKDFDGEGDARFGYGDSWADCAGQIDAHLDATEVL